MHCNSKVLQNHFGDYEIVRNITINYLHRETLLDTPTTAVGWMECIISTTPVNTQRTWHNIALPCSLNRLTDWLKSQTKSTQQPCSTKSSNQRATVTIKECRVIVFYARQEKKRPRNTITVLTEKQFAEKEEEMMNKLEKKLEKRKPEIRGYGNNTQQYKGIGAKWD